MSSYFIDRIKLDYDLKKLQQGSTTALEEIYRVTYSSIFNYTFSLTRNYHLAEDITQEVYLRIDKYKNKYTSGTNAKAWIYKIAKNLIYTRLKKDGKEVSVDKEVLEFIVDKQVLVKETDLSFVKEAMDVLTDIERQVVTLHIYGELRHYETSQALGIPYEKVRSIYTYALRKIEKRLGGKRYE
ncbi:MAG: RNA polymerase sigma factor [Bacilli bacterium]